MNTTVNNITINSELLQVPDLNFNQPQRWGNKKQYRYQIIIEKDVFLEKTNNFFSEFREAEIEEDDVMEHKELIAYKNINRPDLTTLLNKHLEILRMLIHYNDHEILELLLDKKLPIDCKMLYSVQSMNKVSFEENRICIEGVCFQVNV